MWFQKHHEPFDKACRSTLCEHCQTDLIPLILYILYRSLQLITKWLPRLVSFAALHIWRLPRSLVIVILMFCGGEVHLLTVLLCYSWHASRTTPSISGCTNVCGFRSMLTELTAHIATMARIPGSLFRKERKETSFFSFPVVLLLYSSQVTHTHPVWEEQSCFFWVFCFGMDETKTVYSTGKGQDGCPDFFTISIKPLEYEPCVGARFSGAHNCSPDYFRGLNKTHLYECF